MFKNFFVYTFLVFTIFFSLIFISGQNEQCQKLERLESSLIKNINTQVISYKENLYQIEKEKIKTRTENSNVKLNLIYVNSVK